MLYIIMFCRAVGFRADFIAYGGMRDKLGVHTADDYCCYLYLSSVLFSIR